MVPKRAMHNIFGTQKVVGLFLKLAPQLLKVGVGSAPKPSLLCRPWSDALLTIYRTLPESGGPRYATYIRVWRWNVRWDDDTRGCPAAWRGSSESWSWARTDTERTAHNSTIVFNIIDVETLEKKTRSHPEMVGDMSRVTLNFDLSRNAS